MGNDTGSSEPSQNSDSDQRFSSPTYYDLIAPIENYLARVTALVDGVRSSEERQFLIERLDLQPGDRVLEVAIGTGRNIPLIAQRVGLGGELIGIDLSRAMLRQCRERVDEACTRSILVEATASQLPLRSDLFDAVLHFGGLNSFADRNGAIQEMMRVAKPQSTLVISDKSLPATRPRSLRQRVQAWLKPQLTTPPPIELIPVSDDQIELRWFWGGSMYLLRFSNPE